LLRFPVSYHACAFAVMEVGDRAFSGGMRCFGLLFLLSLVALCCRGWVGRPMERCLEHTRAEFRGATVVVLFALSSVFATDGRSRGED
jgi:hypothetical protein